MIFIPGIVIAVLTFPGVIVHEAAHQLFCRLRKVPVFDVKYFQFDMKTAGYVVHADAPDFTSNFLISLGPFFLNTLLCMLICFPASIAFHVFDDHNLFNYFLVWLGVSIGMHAFPSNQDANVIWAKAREAAKKKNPLAIASFPIVILIYIANVLRVVWFDALYGIFIGIILPSLIFQNMLAV